MENSNLLIFENPEFGQVRTTLVDNEPWFVAADVCKALEIGNPRQAVSRLDDDEKLNTVINSDGIRGNPNMTIVSEPGLYSLILRSRKPEANVLPKPPTVPMRKNRTVKLTAQKPRRTKPTPALSKRNTVKRRAMPPIRTPNGSRNVPSRRNTRRQRPVRVLKTR